MENGERKKLTIQDFQKEYQNKKGEIRRRLDDFKRIWREGSDEKIFSELSYCICTPGTKAEVSDKAVSEMKENELLYRGTQDKIASFLQSKVRFHNHKARYIVETRKFFSQNGNLRIRSALGGLKSPLNQVQCSNRKSNILRDWLAENPRVMGLGFKEASHFLRNIGLGEDLAILDRHILRNLVRYRVIREIPKTLTRRRYLEIEEKMRNFAERMKIPLEELDLLFWSFETGRVLK